MFDVLSTVPQQDPSDENFSPNFCTTFTASNHLRSSLILSHHGEL